MNSKENYINTLRSRAQILRERNGENSPSCNYISCLAGMWAHTFGLSKSLFEKEAVDMNSWFLVGYYASDMATPKKI